MNTNVVMLQLPAGIYDKLQELAIVEHKEPLDIITDLITTAYQRQEWLRNLTQLREQIRQEGGLQVGATRDEVIKQLRRTRREIFETEYAHLYR